MSHLTSCQFCSREGLDANATWCPGCGLCDPIDPTNTADLPISSFDAVQTPDGGLHKFFVCQNSDCSFPVMPHEEKIKQQRDLTRRVIENFRSRRQMLFWLLDGWWFVVSGRPNSALQDEAIAQWRTAFCCPNCRRPVFYRKKYTDMMPEERFEISFKRVWRVILRIPLLVAFLIGSLLLLASIASFQNNIIYGFAVAIVAVYPVILLLGAAGIFGFILSYNVAFDKAEGL